MEIVWTQCQQKNCNKDKRGGEKQITRFRFEQFEHLSLLAPLTHSKLRWLGFRNWIVDNSNSKLSKFEGRNLSDTNIRSKIGFRLKDDVKIWLKLINFWLKSIDLDPLLMDWESFLMDFNPFSINFQLILIPFWLKCQLKDQKLFEIHQKWIEIHQKCQNQLKLMIFFNHFDWIGLFLFDFKQFQWISIHFWWILVPF